MPELTPLERLELARRGFARACGVPYDLLFNLTRPANSTAELAQKIRAAAPGVDQTRFVPPQAALPSASGDVRPAAPVPQGGIAVKEATL